MMEKAFAELNKEEKEVRQRLSNARARLDTAAMRVYENWLLGIQDKRQKLRRQREEAMFESLRNDTHSNQTRKETP